jgi:hypothetical protein
LHVQNLATATPDPPEVRLGGIAGAVERAGQTHHQDGRRLRLESEIGEHVDHQRLLAQQLAPNALRYAVW